MKLVLFGSDLCGGCVEFKQILKSKNIEYIYKNITEELPAMKAFLKLRDNDSAFVSIKQEDRIGIPCLVVDDNRLIFTPEQLAEII